MESGAEAGAEAGAGTGAADETGSPVVRQMERPIEGEEGGGGREGR